MNETIQSPDREQFSDTPTSLTSARIWRAVKRSAGYIIGSDAGLRCAGVAFYGFLSLFPAIAGSVIIFGFFLEASLIERIMDLVGPIIPAGPQSLLTERLTVLQETDDTSLGFGLLLTLGFALWSGTRGTNAMVYAVTRAYREEQERDFLYGVLVSFGLTLLAFVMMAVTLFVIAIIPVIFSLVNFPSQWESLASYLRWPVIATLAFLATLLFYRIAPNRRAAQFDWIAPGAALATLLWLVASWAFSYYVENFGSYDATFGSLAAVVVLLLWLYYSAMIFVFGASLNGELELETRRDTTKGAPRPEGERDAFVADHIRDEFPPGQI